MCLYIYILYYIITVLVTTLCPKELSSTGTSRRRLLSTLETLGFRSPSLARTTIHCSKDLEPGPQGRRGDPAPRPSRGGGGVWGPLWVMKDPATPGSPEEEEWGPPALLNGCLFLMIYRVNPWYRVRVNPWYRVRVNPWYKVRVNPWYRVRVNPWYRVRVNPWYRVRVNPWYRVRVNPWYRVRVNPWYRVRVNPGYRERVNG